MFTWLTMAMAQVATPVPDLNAQRFRPSVDSDRLLWTDSAGRGVGRPSGSVLFHYTREPLLYTPDNGVATAIVRDVLQADLIAAFDVDRFRLGARVPVYLLATSDVLNSAAGLGDVEFDGRINLVDGADAPARLAVLGRMGLPTTTLANALGSRQPTFEVSVAADKELSNLLLALNLGYRGVPAVDLENVKVDDYATVRFGFAYALTEGLDLGAELTGDVPVSGEASDALAFEWMASSGIQVARDTRLRLGFGTALSEGIAAPDLRALAGVAWHPNGPRDADRDGIPDKLDLCKDVPEDLDEEDDLDGCPEDIGRISVMVLDDATGAALLDAQITSTSGLVGTSVATAVLPAGELEVTAIAPGFAAASRTLQLLDQDIDRLVVLRLTPSPPTASLPIEVLSSGGTPIEDATITFGDVEVEDSVTLELGRPHRLDAVAEGYRPGGAWVEPFTGRLEAAQIRLVAERVARTEDQFTPFDPDAGWTDDDVDDLAWIIDNDAALTVEVIGVGSPDLVATLLSRGIAESRLVLGRPRGPLEVRSVPTVE